MTATATTDRAGQIARAFVEARRDATVLPDYPGPLPRSLDEAYAIQDAALAMARGVVAGWKVGRISPPVDGVDRLAGPIFAAAVIEADGGPGGNPGDVAPAAMPIFAEGFGAAEAEFLLRIGTAPEPGKTDFTMAEAAALIDAVHVGIEVASSPFPGINDHGAFVTISDFGNNNGLVVGAAIAGARDLDLNLVPVRVAINGATVGEATAATMLDGPIGAARFLFGSMASRGIALVPGQWISSGAVTGVHRVTVGDEVVASFGDGMTVACRITKA